MAENFWKGVVRLNWVAKWVAVRKRLKPTALYGMHTLVCILHLRTTDLCNEKFLQPYINLLKNGTMVDGSLVWNQGMHAIIHYV